MLVVLASKVIGAGTEDTHGCPIRGLMPRPAAPRVFRLDSRLPEVFAMFPDVYCLPVKL